MMTRIVSLILCIAVFSTVVLSAYGEGFEIGTGISYHEEVWQTPPGSFRSGYWAGVVVGYGFGALSIRGAATVVDLESLAIEREPQFSVWLNARIASLGPVGLYVGGRLNIDPFDDWVGAAIVTDLGVSPIRYTEVTLGMGYLWTLYLASTNARGIYFSVGVLTVFSLTR